ncbi:hypothetical protein [Candidatus Kryptobacter tengchongensis]|nr:hypothetical protein [Candidatus Kryptobacter tengchongensis]
MSSDKIEISYYVKLKDKTKVKDLVRELGQVKGIGGINLFSDEGEI